MYLAKIKTQIEDKSKTMTALVKCGNFEEIPSLVAGEVTGEILSAKKMNGELISDGNFGDFDSLFCVRYKVTTIDENSGKERKKIGIAYVGGDDLDTAKKTFDDWAKGFVSDIESVTITKTNIQVICE